MPTRIEETPAVLHHFAARLWAQTPWGHTQAEHREVLARLQAYCSNARRTPPGLSDAAGARARRAQLARRWQGAAARTRAAPQAGGERYVCSACGAKDGRTDAVVLAACPRNSLHSSVRAKCGGEQTAPR